MKITMLLVVFTISTIIFAQTPAAFNYQTAIRDNAGNILANQNVGIELQIRQGGATGTSVYTETHNVTTNNLGVLDLAVGTGSTSDSFESITWDTNSYWLQVSLDIAGGSSYTLMGASQLLSVPYALNSKTDNDWTVSGTNMTSNVTGNIGIGVSIPPTSKLDIEQQQDFNASSINANQQNFGNALELQTVNATNISSTMYLVNNGLGDGINIEQNNPSTTSKGLQVSNAGLGEAIFLTNTNPANSSSVLTINQQTTGYALEIQTTEQSNTDPAAIFAHFGTQTSVLGINQNNNPTGIITVGDFNYTGTDLRDHIGVRGNASPSTGWGIGVLGNGGNYGVFSIGNTGATGTKSFVIDHPLDPANKTLKHYAIESNEVLNMYRGNAQLNMNGVAVIELPEYFDAINKNFSYQLTPIGTPQNPYIAKEINGNSFTIGGEPNTKVSWVIFANRNDLHMQQNKASLVDELEKTGARKGKYYNPEYYNQPKEKAIIFSHSEVKKETKEKKLH